MKNFNNTFVLRIALAIIFLSHSLHGIFTNNDVNDFGNLFLNKVGFAPFGVALAWIVILSQIIFSILFIINKCIRQACIFNITILIMGIILVHYHEGWFVVGGGRNGMEYSFLLICVLFSILLSDFKKDSKTSVL